jgi:SRSO17 transposase
MTDAQVEKCRKRLEQFLKDLLEPVGRSERRHWGAVYIRGLLLNGERKSIEPLADRSNEGNVQALQQFVGQSPWEWMPLWERLGKRMTAELEPDSVWVIDDTGFAKQGKHSVGVERQYSGTLGKVGNCQVAVSLHHVGEQGSTVLGWRLYLPESWTKDGKRREEAGIPEEVVFKTKWQLSLDMIDQVRAWGLPNRIVVADAGYGVSRGTGRSSTPLCRRYFLNDGSVEQTTTSTSSSLPGARRSIDALRLWKTAADVRAGRGGPSEELEEDSLAARHKRMAGIALRGLTSTTFSWLRPWATTAQGSLVTERMARVGKGTDQVLPL